MAVEDLVDRVNEIAQDELWFSTLCQFESLEKLVKAFINAFVLTPKKYFKMGKG